MEREQKEWKEKVKWEKRPKTPNKPSSSWQAVSPNTYLPEKARWTFAQRGQWPRTPCRGRLSRSRSASAHSSAGSGGDGGGEEKEAEERAEECGIGGTHHSGGGEELHWQRGHWHYTLVIVLHKICLEALVILKEGGTFTFRVRGQGPSAVLSPDSVLSSAAHTAWSYTAAQVSVENGTCGARGLELKLTFAHWFISRLSRVV